MSEERLPEETKAMPLASDCSPDEGSTRRILPRWHRSPEDVAAYLSVPNRIRTTKYTWITFLPKNLFEQFHRVANVYFLLIVCLNWIPQLNVFGKEIAMLPLLFVLAVTAIKDMFEDRRRYLSDKEVNNRTCHVYSRDQSKFISALWKDVQVGDLVMLHSDEIIPADLLLIHSSNQSTHTCYVETANLDGETNLKQRVVPRGLGVPEGKEFVAGAFCAPVFCEEPHNRIYDFTGFVELPDSSKTPLDKDNLLLRGCKVRNVHSIVGMVVYTGHETKALLNNSGAPSKRSKLESKVNQEVAVLILLLAVLCIIGAVGNRLWTVDRDYRHVIYLPGSDLNPDSDAFFLFLSFIIILQVMVPISLYVSIEVVKLIQLYFLQVDLDLYYASTDRRLLCRALNINEDLGQIQYVFSDKTGTLTENDMVFQRCSVDGIEYAHAPDASPMQNKNAKLVDRRLLGPATGPSVPVDGELLPLVTDDCTSVEAEFLIVLALCNTVVVSNRMTSSATLQHNSTSAPGENGAATLVYEAESPDELALVLAAQSYGYVLQGRTSDTVSLKVPGKGVVNYKVLNVLAFTSERKRMSVIVQREEDDRILLYTKGADLAIYGNLAATEKTVGCRSRHVSTSSSPDTNETRMNATLRHLNMYARQGLRTLCVARRVIPKDEYFAWLEEHKSAESAMTNRSELVQMSCSRLEKHLELLGATGIEDRLQDQVPDTIHALRQAGINVWVLTGDKQETAVNVGFSCRLLDDNMSILKMNANNKEQAQELINGCLKEYGLKSSLPHKPFLPGLRRLLSSLCGCAGVVLVKLPGEETQEAEETTRQRALVVDGGTLHYFLADDLRQDFLQVAAQCHAVICCRTTPLQKAGVVQLVHDGLNVMTLAVGDGANDVSMIQMANMGIGIAGVEGMQAVMASDFAIARFYFLQKLLLVHGHWCYDRIARMILYFYYKNALFVLVIFWFQIYNGFSGSVAIEQVNLFLFNLIWTSVPVCVTAVADQNLPVKTLLGQPFLYQFGQKDKVYNKHHFIFTVLDAFWQSLVIYFICHWTYMDSDVGMYEYGATLNTACVIVVTLHLAIETQYWTWIHHLALWASLLVYLAFSLAYNAISVFPPYWAMEHTLGTVEFWMATILIPVIALFPRYLARAVKNTIRPNIVQLARQHVSYQQQSRMCWLSE